MKSRRTSFYILGAFITGTILLIFIQYNSSKNINALINGNEILVNEFKVHAELNDLEKNIISVESRVRGAVSSLDSVYIEGLEKIFTDVENELGQLQKISDDDSSVLFIDKVDTLIQKKLQFNRQILDTLHLSGKSSAERMIGSLYGKRLTDSIIQITARIDRIRKSHLAHTTLLMDKSGKRAQRFSFILIVLVLVCGAGLFWYIINTIQRQELLIQQLNVSEQKVLESARLKENFMANMSHEIRTPMNAILGFTHLLQKKELDEESKEYVKTIQQSGDNLLTIINDILDLSKMEAGMIRLEPVPFNIRDLAQSVEAMLAQKATEKNLRFTLSTELSVPDVLEGDATRLTQILVNLIGNALKFTNKGSVAVTISNEGIRENVIQLGCKVSDTGIGIKKEDLEHIFDRFQQAEDSVTRKYGGTGLGLSIVKDLVSMQHGTMRVDSEPGRGTTFRLIIPYRISSAKMEEPAVHPVRETADIDLGKHSILVVEDNEINQSLIKHLFKSWQLNYDLAKNGREALECLRQKNYNLILMDIQMPEMDGYTATREIRENLKLTTPIIAMTAHALAGEREKCLSCGMNEYISKPIQEKQLHQLIAKFSVLKNPGQLEKRNPVPVTSSAYQYINLQYMKDISGGSTEYEKTVTEQFIEAIPADLLLIEKAWRDHRISDLRQGAHNMKTTVSVMGLNTTVQTWLDALEYENMDEETFRNNFSSLKKFCQAAVEEAGKFYCTL